jgi:hypothetical protein
VSMHRGQQSGVVRVLLLKCALILTLGGVAHAEEDDFTFESDVEEHDGTTESAFEAVLRDTPPATPVVQTPDTNLVWTGLPRLGSDDGEYCIGRNWVQLPRDDVEEAERNAWQGSPTCSPASPNCRACCRPTTAPSIPPTTYRQNSWTTW